MADGPSTVAMYSVWAYWLGVLLMAVRVRFLGAGSAGIVPKQPLERLMWVVWVPVIAAWIVFPWLSIHRSSPPWQLPEPALAEPVALALRRFAAGLTAACLVGTMFCWRWMGRNWRVGVEIDEPVELITTGPFGRMRHPIYTLSIAMFICTLVAIPILPLLAAAVLHIVLIIAKARNEESWMLRVHGEAYTEYRERTGRFFPRIPKVKTLSGGLVDRASSIRWVGRRFNARPRMISPGGSRMVGERKTAACLAVGSELLGDQRLDSNSLTITRALARFDVVVTEKRVAGDSVEDVATAIRELLQRHDLVVVTGGLGPTADDVTRDAVALALDRTIERNTEIEGWIRDRYADLGRTMPEVCTVMARAVEGSRPLKNARGSAPGLMVETGGHLLAVFPGVPWEMEEMLERDLVPEIATWNPGVSKFSRTLLLGGVVESDTEQEIHHLYDVFGRENVTILAHYGVLRLVLSAEGEEKEALVRIDEMETAFRTVLGEDVAGVDVGGLSEVVLDRLRQRGETLATAESCTGGMISASLTDVPGASDVFLGGVVSYSNDAKEKLLGVPHEMLLQHGAVSEEVARAMASGACAQFGSDWGIGITGIAGPTGGTEEKPVGLVHWAVAGPRGVSAGHRVSLGNRSIVREWSMNAALDLLRRRLATDS